MTDVTASDLFAEGWLEDELDQVVSRLAALPKHLQPVLTGERSRAMADPNWLPTSDDARYTTEEQS